MLWLTCPNCGNRPVEEWRFGGEFPTIAPQLTDPDERDVDYVWMFDNIDGPSNERWFHEAGCRRWSTFVRNTRSDAFSQPD